MYITHSQLKFIQHKEGLLLKKYKHTVGWKWIFNLGETFRKYVCRTIISEEDLQQ